MSLPTETGPAETLLVGARVRTLDPDRPEAHTVAVRGGVIVGLDDDATALRDGATQVIDLAGATLTPGLVDGHTHPLLGAEGFAGVDLSSCLSVDDLRATVAREAAGLEPGDWLQGFALDHNVFAGGPITSAAIDDLLVGVPAMLRLYDGHSALVSSEALRRAGVDGPRQFSQRSEVVCDADGRPTGHLLEAAAMELVEEAIPPMSLTERRERAMAVLTDMAATGLTGGHVMDGTRASLELLARLEEDGDLPLRLRLAPWCMPGTDPAELVAVQGTAGRRWRVSAVKFFIDGTVEGGTAWLERPDCHGQSTDSFWLDPTEYTRSVQHLAAAGVQTATHAIGDAGVRHVLDTLDGVDTRGVRHRIEHLETLPLDQVRRLARLGVVASMQPSHTSYTKADHSDEWSIRLGPERAERAWCCRDFRDAGATLVLGSDWPIAGFDAREVLTYARFRQGAGSQLAPVLPDQALTGVMALEGMTSQAAYVAGEEHTSGRVAVGCRADLTAFSVDPVEAPADELAQAPIRLTMLEGTITHRL